MSKPSYYMLLFENEKPYRYYAARTKQELIYKLKEIERIKGHKLKVIFQERNKYEKTRND